LARNSSHKNENKDSNQHEVNSQAAATIIMPPDETKQRPASVRSMSFAKIDETESSGILSNLFRANQVFLGGAAMGIGLTKAARFYLNERAKSEAMAVEESFYVVDLGVIVSQVYQWRNYFPRVEPFYGTSTIASSCGE
jgi:hypothetical protein